MLCFNAFASYPDFGMESVLRLIFVSLPRPYLSTPRLESSLLTVLPYMFEALLPPSPSLSASVFLFWHSIKILVGGWQEEHSCESARVERHERADSPCLRLGWRTRRGAVAKTFSANFFFFALIKSNIFVAGRYCTWRILQYRLMAAGEKSKCGAKGCMCGV